ncbi:MAG: Zn-ribbon domain-containing OB-fold protein [Burkholderiales bacterium]
MSETAEQDFPLPDTTGAGAHYWGELKQGRLVYQRCNACHHAWLPPRAECPKCLAADWVWANASGKAKLISWVVYHHAYHPWFAKKLPYNVSVVELAEGPRLVSNVIDTGAKLRIDMPLQLVIESEGDVALARFRVA